MKSRRLAVKSPKSPHQSPHKQPNPRFHRLASAKAVQVTTKVSSTASAADQDECVSGASGGTGCTTRRAASLGVRSHGTRHWTRDESRCGRIGGCFGRQRVGGIRHKGVASELATDAPRLSSPQFGIARRSLARPPRSPLVRGRRRRCAALIRCPRPGRHRRRICAAIERPRRPRIEVISRSRSRLWAESGRSRAVASVHLLTRHDTEFARRAISSTAAAKGAVDMG